MPRLVITTGLTSLYDEIVKSSSVLGAFFNRFMMALTVINRAPSFSFDEEEVIEKNLKYMDAILSELHANEPKMPKQSNELLMAFKRKWRIFFNDCKVSSEHHLPRIFRNSKLAERLPRNKRFVEGEINANKVCNYCNRRGHYMKNCRSLLRLCFTCGSPDHFMSKCPMRTCNDMDPSDGRFTSRPVVHGNEVFAGSDVSRYSSRLIDTHDTQLVLENRFSLLFDECEENVANVLCKANCEVVQRSVVNYCNFATAKYSYKKSRTKKSPKLKLISSSLVQQTTSVVQVKRINEEPVYSDHSVDENAKNRTIDSEQSTWVTADMVNELEHMKRKLSEYKAFLRNQSVSEQTIESAVNWSVDSENEEFPSADESFGSDSAALLEDYEIRTKVDEESTGIVELGKNSPSIQLPRGFLTWLLNSLQLQSENIDKVIVASTWLHDGWLDDITDVLSLEDCDFENSECTNRKDFLTDVSDKLHYIIESVKKYIE